MIVTSICLSDLPKDRITTSEKNGKKYISLVIDERKEADNYGNTHTAYVNQTKEERDAKTPKCYVGNGKEYKFQKVETVVAEEVKQTEPKKEDTLPF